MTSPSAKLAAGLWVRLAKCHGLVLREVRAGQGESTATLAQFDALAQLLRHPQGMTAGQLSEALLVTAGSVTGLVDRMLAQGWVTREPSPADQRVRNIRLTPAGRRVARREVTHHEHLLQRIFEGLEAREQRELVGQLDRVRSLLEQGLARSRKPRSTRPTPARRTPA